MRRWSGWVLALAVIGFGATSLEAAKADAKAPKKSPEERFAKLDANSDGKLSLDEFIGKRKDDKKAMAEKQFKKKDKDRDGFLSVEEFKAMPKKKNTSA